MRKYIYPAVFHKEEEGYSVFVPDLPGCFSQGDTLEEAFDMTYDAIGLCLEDLAEPPAPSEPNQVLCPSGDFTSLIPFDMIEYKKKHENRSVKKTLTIPSWLNSLAEEQHVNFSGLLQEALRQHLGV